MTNLMALAALLIGIESGGHDRAVSPDRRCWGPLQIKAVYVKDVNRVAGTRYTRADAFDRQKAVEMFMKYVEYYATKERLKRDPTLEDIARIHHGGPNGWRNPRTKRYWRKVELAMATGKEVRLRRD